MKLIYIKIVVKVLYFIPDANLALAGWIIAAASGLSTATAVSIDVRTIISGAIEMML